MKRPRRQNNTLAYALYANAAVLLGILLVLLLGNRPGSFAFAGGPQQGPIAGGGGIFVMPAQFHSTVWGVYLLDVDRQTLCAYEYREGEKALVLTAARSFRYDLQLKQLNTFPDVNAIQKLLAAEADNSRAIDSVKPPINPETPKESPKD